jgi:hypothetical protein
MKAKFLKRSESEKSDKVKVIFEVEGSEVAKAMQLTRAEVYSIELHEPKLPGVVMTPQEQIIAGLRLITEAVPRIPEERQPTLDLSPRKPEKVCKTCFFWKRLPNQEKIQTPLGFCDVWGDEMPLHHHCEKWRDRDEEDKSEEGRDAEGEEGGVREQVAGEARTD